METKLKPCPLCGGRAHLDDVDYMLNNIKDDLNSFASVRCTDEDCDLNISVCFDEFSDESCATTVANLWNKRFLNNETISAEELK